MKGLSSQEYIEMINFIQKYHKFGFIRDNRDNRDIFPKINEHGLHIKYVDVCYDTRFSDIWSVSFRGMSNDLSFKTNNCDNIPYESLFDWIMDYLKGEWMPTLASEARS